MTYIFTLCLLLLQSLYSNNFLHHMGILKLLLRYCATLSHSHSKTQELKVAWECQLKTDSQTSTETQKVHKQGMLPFVSKT